MLRRRSIAVVSLFLVLLLNPPAHAADDAPADLVLVQQDTLPIIMTVPHGGRQAIPEIAERNIEGKTGGRGKGKWAGFVKGGDFNTDILAQDIAAEIQELTGKAPYRCWQSSHASTSTPIVRRRSGWITPRPGPTTTTITTPSAASSARYAANIQLVC